MAESIDFEELLLRLPRGGMTGDARPEFGIAASSDLFFPPALSAVDDTASPFITLISARGATGKSVLARQISAVKGVPLWRLDADAAKAALLLKSLLNCVQVVAEDVDPLGLNAISA